MGQQDLPPVPVQTPLTDAKGFLTSPWIAFLRQLRYRVGGSQAPTNNELLSNPMTALGDLLYGAASGAPARLPGNATATRGFLRQTGTGVASAAPAWDTIAAGDLPAINLASSGAGGVTGNLGVANLAGGTGATSSTFWCGDGTWKAISGSGTVTSLSIVSANGFAGSVATATTTPALTLTTTVTGMVKGDGTAFSAASSGTDYAPGTAALATGILKSTTTTGALSVAVAADFPTLNQNTTGSAANFTGALLGDVTGTQGVTAVAKIAGVAVGTPTGTGNVVFSASPTFTGTVTCAAGAFSGNLTTNGKFGTGGAVGSSGMLKLNGNALSGTTQLNIDATTFTATSAATSRVDGIRSGATTAAAAFTCSVLTNFYSQQIAKGAGSTITTRIAYLADAPTDGTNNAILADGTAFSGSYFINQVGTTASVFGGAVQHKQFTTAGPVSTDASGNLSSQATLPASQLPLPTSQTKTGAYTALATDTIVIMDCSTTGSFSTTLPSAATGRPIWITRKDASFTAANTATIARAGSDTIVDNGTTATTTTLATQNESVLIIPDGTSSWFVASRNYPRTWSTYTMTWGGTTSAPTIPTSGVTVNVASYRREGAGMWIRYEYKQTATTGAAAGSGTYLFPIPSGFTMDTANLGTLGDDASCIAGTASWKFGTSIYTAKVSILNSTKLILEYLDVTAASNAWTAFASSTSSIAGQANIEFSFLVYVPISGWN